MERSKLIMPNIVVTSTANYIKVEFNDYYPNNHPVKTAYYNANDIEKVELYADMVTVHLIADPTADWELSYDGSAGFEVDTVDGVAPTSNADLCDKLGALIQA